jgi:hypothetical protein
MLGDWCDWFVVMEDRYRSRVPASVPAELVLVCEVGEDHYGNSHHSALIDKCWRWCRENQTKLAIKEHFRRI